MKVQLINNQKAGSNDRDHQRLILALQEAGFQVQLLPMDGNAEPTCCNLVVLCGGDGTVGKAIRRFYPTLAAEAIPVTIVATGTANNIATSFGLDPEFEAKIKQWGKRETELDEQCQPFAVGELHDGCEPALFLESVGFGLLTRLIEFGDEQKAQGNSADDPREEVRMRRQDLLSLLPEAPACRYRIEVDGHDLSGDYLMVEVMNIPRIGPSLPFSPDSDPGDDQLEVLLIAPTEKTALAEFVNATLAAGQAVAPPFVRARGRQIKITGPASDLHIDDQRYTGRGETTLRLRTLAPPLRLLTY